MNLTSIFLMEQKQKAKIQDAYYSVPIWVTKVSLTALFQLQNQNMLNYRGKTPKIPEISAKLF
jgi:hypothetical protein